MSVDIRKKTWLADLVSSALTGYDPAAALLRLPPELRGADFEGPGLEARSRTLLVRSLRRKLIDTSAQSGDDAFLAPVEGHVALALDIALVHGVAFDPERRKAELASFFAALSGEFDLTRAAHPPSGASAPPAAVRKAFVRAGAYLKTRGDPPGDPKDGLPLRAGVLCIERRLLARIAMAFYAGSLQHDMAAVRKLAEHASADVVLLVEALSAIACAPGPLDGRHRRIAFAQVERLGLPRDLARQARAAVRSPRAIGELAKASPVRLRGFLLEQLLLSELASGQGYPQRAALVQAFAEAADIPPEQVVALQADAAELFAGQQRWLDAGPTGAEEWESLAGEWEEVADEMMEKVAGIVTDNIEAIVTEVRQTGELGQLLAKAASGKTLDGEEKRKVRRQLLDLAKAVPALAIFAAPGGMLLLPILAKLLPFSVLPSAWDGEQKAARRAGKRTTGA